MFKTLTPIAIPGQPCPAKTVSPILYKPLKGVLQLGSSVKFLIVIAFPPQLSLFIYLLNVLDVAQKEIFISSNFIFSKLFRN